MHAGLARATPCLGTPGNQHGQRLHALGMLLRWFPWSYCRPLFPTSNGLNLLALYRVLTGSIQPIDTMFFDSAMSFSQNRSLLASLLVSKLGKGPMRPTGVGPGDKNHEFRPRQRVSKQKLIKPAAQPVRVVSIHHKERATPASKFLLHPLRNSHAVGLQRALPHLRKAPAYIRNPASSAESYSSSISSASGQAEASASRLMRNTLAVSAGQ